MLMLKRHAATAKGYVELLAIGKFPNRPGKIPEILSVPSERGRFEDDLAAIPALARDVLCGGACLTPNPLRRALGALSLFRC